MMKVRCIQNLTPDIIPYTPMLYFCTCISILLKLKLDLILIKEFNRVAKMDTAIMIDLMNTGVNSSKAFIYISASCISRTLSDE